MKINNTLFFMFLFSSSYFFAADNCELELKDNEIIMEIEGIYDESPDKNKGDECVLAGNYDSKISEDTAQEIKEIEIDGENLEELEKLKNLCNFLDSIDTVDASQLPNFEDLTETFSYDILDEKPMEEPKDMGGSSTVDNPDKEESLAESAFIFLEPCSLDDVAGDLSDDQRRLVFALKSRAKMKALGIKAPHGILLVGKPGTGKTLFARAVAGSSDSKFMHVSAAVINTGYAGDGTLRLKSIFNAARELVQQGETVIIFVDEVDAIGFRNQGSDSGSINARQTINQLLIEMGQDNEGITVIAATNEPKHIDPALKRSGRFSLTIEFELPDALARLDILLHHLAKHTCMPNLDVKKIAKKTKGFSAADLERLVHEAAFSMMEFNDSKIIQADLNEGYKRIKNKLDLDKKQSDYEKEKNELNQIRRESKWFSRVGFIGGMVSMTHTSYLLYKVLNEKFNLNPII